MNTIIKEILDQIINAGFEAYLVGGYPRDYYLSIKTDDYDITTNATPEELKLIFPKANFENAHYGRVTIENLEETIEITTYRKEENYHCHRFPQTVVFVKTLKEDLLRRDFIINTLCMDAQENYIDLLNAKKDLDDKIIQTVGNANQKIEQDALRILRAIRFASTLNFKLTPELVEAIRKNKDNLKDLSYFRKKEELNRIFVSKYVKKEIPLLKELEEPLEIYGLEHVNVDTSLLGIWAQLDFSPKYEFSRNERKGIEKIRILLEEDILDPFVLYTYGHYYCGIASEIKGIPKSKVLEAYQNLPIHHRTEIALSPKELERLVSKEMIGTVYDDLETQILKGSLENLKVFLKKYVIQKYNRRKQ